MDFSIRGKVARSVVSRIRRVATQGIASEFAQAGHITIRANDGRVSFLASNGIMVAAISVDHTSDPYLKGIRVGHATVSSADLVNVVHAVSQGRDDHPVRFRVEGDRFHIGEHNSFSTLPRHIEWTAPACVGFRARIPAGEYCAGVHAVTNYAECKERKIRYQMICLHWVDGELRFVCGDGRRFGIYTSPSQEIDEAKYVLPVDQARIVASLINRADDLILVFPTAQECVITNDKDLHLLIRQIPSEPYIHYERRAYGTADASAILDIDMQALKQAIAHVSTTFSRELDDQGIVHAVQLTAESKRVELLVNQPECAGRCEISIQGDYYDFGGLPKIQHWLAVDHLADVAAAAGDVARFYFIPNSPVVIVDTVDLYTRTDDGPPDIAMEHLRFFFALLVED